MILHQKKITLFYTVYNHEKIIRTVKMSIPFAEKVWSVPINICRGAVTNAQMQYFYKLIILASSQQQTVQCFFRAPASSHS